MDQAIIQLEKDFWAASQNPAFYETHVAPEALFLMPDANGIYTKRQCMDIISHNKKGWDSYELLDIRVIQESKNLKIIAYDVHATKNGILYEALVSTTYVLKNDHWVLLLHQQTPHRHY